MDEEKKDETNAEEMDFTGIELEEKPKEEEQYDKEEEQEETEEKGEEDEGKEEETEEKKLSVKEDKPKEPTLEDIQKKLDEEAEKRAVIEKQLADSKLMQDNSVVIGRIDNELAKIDMEAQKLLGLEAEAEKAQDAGVITAAEYKQAVKAIFLKAFELKQKRDEIIAHKSKIPAPQDFIRKQQVITENDKFYEEFEKNIEDEIVKKHVKKLKNDHYDPYAVELSKATDWNSNVDWIKDLVKEAEARGFQKAQEKFQEKIAKGKTKTSSNNAQGANPKVIVNNSNIGNLKKGDVDKALTFY